MFNKIFDELIEVKCFKNYIFQESYVKYFMNKKSQLTIDTAELQDSYVKYFKETKRLKSLQKAEAYLEPNQASKMELHFIKYLTAYYFRNKSFIIDIRLGHTEASKNNEIFKVKLGSSKSS